ncbi:RNA recognition motif domain [Macleaya cordata]|uniref:RNA recognition motif domain n=1 Tax=Macleaya cordata TaxID=56857 RepID=A0A200RDJ9_MACCD|nr:RNA recognition motif domain [Macleaya cordata]
MSKFVTLMFANGPYSSQTTADPVILAKYVAALLKKEKPIKELRNLCAENLVEFLGQSTESFITKLFQVLDNGSIITLPERLAAIERVDLSQSLTTEDPTKLRNSSPKPGCSPSGHGSYLEEIEASDDDDDRNHKHRRREIQTQLFDKDVEGRYVKRPKRKRNKPFENGQMFLDSDPQSSENQKEYNPASSERKLSTKFDRKHTSLAPFQWTPIDLGRWTRVNQAFQGEPWSQHDSKYNSVDTLDFALQMASRGTTPGLFAGRGLQTFGLIPGMPNGSLDALPALSLQGTLGPPINQSLGIGMPRQRCRDFEERGFCLRGDICPMEHGVNRIVVKDVQSLSQFNLPVSLPSANLLGLTAGTGDLASGSAPSDLSTHIKSLHGKSNKPGMTDNGLGLSRLLSVSTGSSEADLYDPDQPLWNNDHPETSNALIGPASPKVEDATPLWKTDRPGCHICMLPNGIDSECFCRSTDSVVGPHRTSSSVWGRIRYPGNNLDMTGKLGGYTTPGAIKKQIASNDAAPKAISSAAKSKLQSDPARKNGRQSQNAFRTLYVNGIPPEKNKIEALLSHFRKFGVVIDIYIPLNCERAFVQFSKREEAEAALNAPDAVMGNRFIKLSWANRDRIIGNGVSSSDTHVLPQPSVADRKKDLPSIPQKVNVAPAFNIKPAAVHPKPVVINGLTSSQKKMESMEILKEELRLKQEMLDQKRKDFRRQLDRIEKQVITVKGEATAEQAVKRHKEGKVSEAACPRPAIPVSPGYEQGAKKTLDKTNPGKNFVSPSTKTKSSTVLQSPWSLKQPSCSSASLDTFLLENRFKLDNRPTTFKVLPPLPADFANVVVLKEHFSAFGDLSAVELGDSDTHADPACLKPSETSCACITFTSRHAAERAFSNGKCWQGQNLQFAWLTASRNFIDDHHGGTENFPTPTLKGLSDAEALAKTVAPALSLSSSSMRRSTCTVSRATTSTSNREAGNPEEGGLEPMVKVENCASSHATKSLCESLSPKADILFADDGMIVNFVQ